MAVGGVGATAGAAAMIQITEIHWIAEYRFCVRFSDDSVGGCDLRPLLGENISDDPQRDSAFTKVLLVEGVPTWRNGLKVAPAQLRQHIDTAMCRTLLLDDTSDAILIGKSGEPVPAPNLLAWLATNCRHAWHYHYDGVWNMYFRFEDACEAEDFKRRWKARECARGPGQGARPNNRRGTSHAALAAWHEPEVSTRSANVG
jgi:hypothetical protein